jgi:DNA polymerase-1
MHVLIDGDIIVYRAGFGAQMRGEDIPVSYSLHNCRSIIRKQIKYLREFFPVEQVTVFLSADDKSNFRYEVAKTQVYKGNRVDSVKPIHYTEMKEFMVEKFNALMVTGQEADDEMGIWASEDPDKFIIVSADKDMRMTPGWHWEMTDRPPYFVDDPGFLQLEKRKANRPKLFGTGLAWFYAQVLMGDRADHIPGIPGIADVRAYNLLKNCKTVEDYKEVVEKVYKEEKLSLERLKEVKELLWIRRKRK